MKKVTTFLITLAIIILAGCERERFDTALRVYEDHQARLQPSKD